MNLTSTTPRFAGVPAFTLAAALAAAGMAMAPGVAQASTTSPPQTFTAAGTYQVTVPSNATSVHLVGLGGAGQSGGGAPSDYGAGGAGGHGEQASEDVMVDPFGSITPGSTLTVTVGAVGGGGPGGSPGTVFGAPFAGFGGAGGGATTITTSDGTTLMVAAGGGGGGGGGNGDPGASGGTDSDGQPTSIDGVIAARAGAYGGPCTVPLQVQPGDSGESTGESPGTLFSLGGGGGGGGEGCTGGGGGGSGDHGAGGPADGTGGGGGGSGGSAVTGGSNIAWADGTNTGDGSATITFTTPSAGDGPYSTTLTVSADPVRLGDYTSITTTPVVDALGLPAPFITASVYVIAPDGTVSLVCQDPVCDFDTGTPGLSPGFYQVAAYGPESSAPIGSTAFQVLPPLAATTTTLTPSASPAQFGQPVTFTATVTPGETGAPTGTVTFTDGSTDLAEEPLSPAGNATYTSSALPAGPHTITATYSGDDTYAGSTSSPLAESITPPTAPLAITTTGSLPSGTVGRPYSATLTAAGGTTPYSWALAPGSALPTGLNLHSDGTIDGTPTVASTGIVVVQATDSGRPAQASLARLSLVVAAGQTRTSLSSSAAPALQRQPITLTARVTAPAGTPLLTGRVTFADGSSVLGTAALGRSGVATFTTSSLTVGSHELTATYAGDSAELSSTSAALTEFVRRVTPARLAAQATGYVQASAAYVRLSPAQRQAAVAGITQAAQQLSQLGGSSPARKQALIKAFGTAVKAAESRGYLTAAQALTLIGEASTL